MATHGFTDIMATVELPKSEYEDLVRQREELKIIKKTMKSASSTLPLVVLKHILGINEGENDEEENSKNSSKFGNTVNCNSQ